MFSLYNLVINTVTANTIHMTTSTMINISGIFFDRWQEWWSNLVKLTSTIHTTLHIHSHIDGHLIKITTLLLTSLWISTDQPAEPFTGRWSSQSSTKAEKASFKVGRRENQAHWSLISDITHSQHATGLTKPTPCWQETRAAVESGKSLHLLIKVNMVSGFCVSGCQNTRGSSERRESIWSNTQRSWALIESTGCDVVLCILMTCYMLSLLCRFSQCHTLLHNCAWSGAWTHTRAHTHANTHTPFGSLPCGLIVSRLKGLKPLGFNHDEMMFGPVS